MRALRVRALVATVTLLSAGTSAAMLATAAANAAARISPRTPGICTAAASSNAHVRTGHISGIVGAVPVRGRCKVHNAGDPANGVPPLLFHGGAVMGTPSTGPVVITPIFWDTPGHTIPGPYRKIITSYLLDLAGASGSHTNVFSTLNEYFGTNGSIRYQVELGNPIIDTDPLPPSACTVAATDTSGIYADNTGYDACLDDAQVNGEIDGIVTARNLPRDLGHLYVMYLPKHVETCFSPGSTTTSANSCTINHQPSARFCAYHSQAATGTVYANLPFPVYTSGTGFTCGSDARFAVVQTPNGNADADTEVSPTSHEVMEAITDPDTITGWYDSKGLENGDECAYVFGVTQGTAGQFYNQVIGGHHYLTQEEFSNLDFAATGGGCLQSE